MTENDITLNFLQEQVKKIDIEREYISSKNYIDVGSNSYFLLQQLYSNRTQYIKMIELITKTISDEGNDFLSIPDIRNKLGPISNLLAIVDNEKLLFFENVETKNLIVSEIKNCKTSIKYLSNENK